MHPTNLDICFHYHEIKNFPEISFSTQGLFRSELFNFLVLRNVPGTLLIDFWFHSVVRKQSLIFQSWNLLRFYILAQHRVYLGGHSISTEKKDCSKVLGLINSHIDYGKSWEKSGESWQGWKWSTPGWIGILIEVTLSWDLKDKR